MENDRERLNNIMPEERDDTACDAVTEEEKHCEKKKKKSAKYALVIAVCIVAVIGIISINGGLLRCGSSSDSSMDMAYDTGENYYIESDMDESSGEFATASYGESEYITEYEEKSLNESYALDSGSEDSVNVVESDSAKELKLIYRADMSVQTTDFEKAVSDLEKLVSENDGYFESKEIYNGGMYSNGEYLTGYYVVRVPQEKYESFVQAVGEACYVVNKSESVEDVGQAYYDIESHIKTLEIKEERLQELLKKATNMSDIIEIESALSETEHSLENYKSDLERYDSLINYSTVSINIEKVTQYSPQIDEQTGFFGRIWSSIKNGVINFGEGLTDFLAWLGYNLLPIITIIVILLVFIRFDVIGRIGKLIERIRIKSQKNKK